MTREEAIELLETYDFPEGDPRLTQAAYMGAAALREELEDGVALTPEELREMDGEPVWVIAPDNAFEPCWMLVMVRHNFVMANWQYCDFMAYGTTWLAYRRKPEEGIT